MLRLNQIAQGVIPVEDEIARLSTRPFAERAATFNQLRFMISQAGASPADVAVATRNAGLVDQPHSSLLPDGEMFVFGGSFPEEVLGRLEPNLHFLVALFRIADARRREACGGECQHWWHADLSDPDILEQPSVQERSWWRLWRSVRACRLTRRCS